MSEVVEVAQEAHIPPTTIAVLPKVVMCESSASSTAEHINAAHYNKKGDFIATTTDYGIGQINSLHWQQASDMGYDVHTIAGNIEYMIYLVKNDGLNDYQASKSCWSNTQTSL